MGFIDRASSSFFPSCIPLKNVGSLLNAHITTTFCFHRCSRELSSLLIISSNSLSIISGRTYPRMWVPHGRCSEVCRCPNGEPYQW